MSTNGLDRMMPLYPKLPWLSDPSQPFPSRQRRKRRRSPPTVRLGSVEVISNIVPLRSQFGAPNVQATSRAEAVSIPEQILSLESKIAHHLSSLEDLRTQLAHLKTRQIESRSSPSYPYPLSPTEYKRYGRQLIMPEIGLPGQLELKRSSVLIVGAGGLGCPAAAYLAGAGVGRIGIVDGDVIEESNLQRQIMYGGKTGQNKADSLRDVMNGINHHIETRSYPSHLSPENAIGLISEYSIVLDCTDNPASRYLISDACVLANKPLVSASALRTDGQLIVLNNPPKPPGEDGSPCYRCIFPKPPPPDSVLKCADGGILGPVVGTMGVLQALEAIKVIISRAKPSPPVIPPSLLIFSATSTPPFRSVRLKPTRKNDCVVCSASASLTAASITQGSMDYVQFCGTSDIIPLESDKRVSAAQYAQVINTDDRSILIDVRDETQFQLCNLSGSVNIPWSPFASKNELFADQVKSTLKANSGTAYVVCRLGNDSQDAVRRLEQLGFNSAHGWIVKDITGGLRSWKAQVDPEFPEY